jgi:hypothetical protein
LKALWQREFVTGRNERTVSRRTQPDGDIARGQTSVQGGEAAERGAGSH